MMKKWTEAAGEKKNKCKWSVMNRKCVYMLWQCACVQNGGWQMSNLYFCFSFIIYYPNVDPIINSACELIVSAIKSSLKASLGLFQMRPFRKIGRSWGVSGPNALFCLRTFGLLSACFSSACKSAFRSPVRLKFAFCSCTNNGWTLISTNELD